MYIYPDAKAVARALEPDEPIILNRPHAARRAARFFVEKFPGKVLYAVKANPAPDLIQVLWEAGVTHYDVASIAEVRLVREALNKIGPEANMCFMHPIKRRRAIAEAYHQHGVKTFSLDSDEELEKIVIEVGESKIRDTKFSEAIALFQKLVTQEEFEEFLTLSAYPLI